MPDSQIVSIPLGPRSCDIEIGRHLLPNLGERITQRRPTRRATLITDAHLAPLYLPSVIASLANSRIEAAPIIIPPGESSKSALQLAKLYDALALRRHARDELLIALGGGVISDLAGFAAATWMRGIPWIACPTSLEAMIDASIGGKTAINHPAGKNLIGAFHHPAYVCTDLDCLATLPETEFRSALAESVKHALIADESFLAWHECHAADIHPGRLDLIDELVPRNVRIKARIVAEDERETASSSPGRAALNFGHTIAHALEADSDWTLRHGDAVALGMIVELRLAAAAGLVPPSDVDRLIRLLDSLRLPARLPCPPDPAAIHSRILLDKKSTHAEVRFVVPAPIGKTTWLALKDVESLATALN